MSDFPFVKTSRSISVRRSATGSELGICKITILPSSDDCSIKVNGGDAVTWLKTVTNNGNALTLDFGDETVDIIFQVGAGDTLDYIVTRP